MVSVALVPAPSTVLVLKYHWYCSGNEPVALTLNCAPCPSSTCWFCGCEVMDGGVLVAVSAMWTMKNSLLVSSGTGFVTLKLPLASKLYVPTATQRLEGIVKSVDANTSNSAFDVPPTPSRTKPFCVRSTRVMVGVLGGGAGGVPGTTSAQLVLIRTSSMYNVGP